MKRTMNHVFAVLLVLTTGGRAVSFGAALSLAQQTKANESRTAAAPAIPRSVMFREVPGRGLVVRGWINSAGPFDFAVDTGAGAILLSPQAAAEAHVPISAGRASSIAGLSGVNTSAHEASIRSLAIGDAENFLPAKGLVMITSGLPRGIDGVLDPTEAFAPLGYVIDLPRHELSAFDARELPLKLAAQPADGAVVQWLREGHGRRPFVQLDNGERALLDTGSNFGLAIRSQEPGNERVSDYSVRDVGGGRVSARRARPSTVAVGSLTLRNTPTAVISGAEAEAPVVLGLSALRPFRMRFDPVHHLIEIAPGQGRSR